MMQISCSAEKVRPGKQPAGRRVSLGSLSSRPYCPCMPISKSISRTSSSDLLRKSRRDQPDKRPPSFLGPPGLEIAGRNLAQPIPGQAAQLLGCLYLQHRREMLLAPARCRRVKRRRRGRIAVCGSRRAIIGAAQVAYSQQPAALLAEDKALACQSTMYLAH